MNLLHANVVDFFLLNITVPPKPNAQLANQRAPLAPELTKWLGKIYKITPYISVGAIAFGIHVISAYPELTLKGYGLILGGIAFGSNYLLNEMIMNRIRHND